MFVDKGRVGISELCTYSFSIHSVMKLGYVLFYNELKKVVQIFGVHLKISEYSWKKSRKYKIAKTEKLNI